MPRNPPIETRTETFTLRFTPKQIRAVRRTARRAGKTLSEWIRDILLVQLLKPTRRAAALSAWPALPPLPAPVRPLRKAR